MVDSVADLTWPEAGARGGAILAVPVGATEQHGPHLPLSTDTDVALALCRRVSAARPQVLVAPAIPYGASGEHADFPGTLSIGQAALELVLVELCRSATASFARIVLVNGHGGNIEPLRRAVALLRAESRDVRAYSPRGYSDPHAGRSETALCLAIDPAGVRLDRAEKGVTAPLSELMPRLMAEGVRAVSPNGVLGDPTGATAAEGRALLDRSTDDLLDRLRLWWPEHLQEGQP
ncbi:mycofactocin biosynthesis peptidyl-dipeptidase MftE [Nocardia panacis]|uniref:Mycofactocin biosynthesis peptidyl-dipeptidase MftE n=1 Tax=Nocardia panacis TaxID=2340916 RepID=A0A3A4JYG0_9NOCA|nr:mycofactocin biosynthesis peptidyl-dipeptidase MftE [Nocardia panacis]RJO68213.1 mycofactocin biosynthesis peptidyl-dipeptidase MftE [Nocardia panacis]